MKIYRSLRPGPPPRAARSVAIGIFDGVHLGHQRILAAARAQAAALKGGRTTVVTFDPHPVRVLAPHQPHSILQSLEHRLRFFAECGVDETVVLRFDRRTASVTRESFLSTLLRGLGMKALSVGPDFRFGKGGKGDVRFLRERSHEMGFRLRVVPPRRSGGLAISSTRIRRLIESGRLREASSLLGRPVSVYGRVVRGHGRGKRIGYPTANLDPHHEALPPDGVYAAWGLYGGRRLRGVIHIGRRPTFGERDRSIEVHFLDFHESLYGKNLELIFVARLRGIRRFRGPAALARAIRRDVERAQALLAPERPQKAALQSPAKRV